MSPTNLLFTLSFIIFTIGFTFRHTHLLSALLCLEGMMLSVFLLMAAWSLNSNISSFILPLTVLTLSACEAGIGLALLIASARTHNTANLKNLNLLQC
uniref:NADH-ubiquinone oxidoreductase chain 4L n=1 Tax=Crocodylus mindorensis TaxID=184236 RepID=E3T1L5_CROMD|nr:NADH dehydrogenase subunit 4L [Crocodylus mindorensis]ACZ02727.1 NADH dehydrogenase subunit 4L [Crocodylus mindorensis]